MVGLRGAVAPDAGLFRARRPRDRRDPQGRGRRRHAARRRHRRAADGRRPRGRGASPSATASRSCSTPARSSRSTRSSCSTRPARWSTAPTSCISEQLKPGVRESELVADVTQVPVRPRLGARRQHQRRLGRALQPAPARLQRPDHPARRPGLLRHHPHVRRLQDLLLPDVRGRQGERRPARRLQAGARVDRRVDRADAAGRRHRPGRQRLAEGRGVRVRRTRWSASASSSATASGLFLHERPIISRLNSLEHPVELKEGMVIALETYCPAKDGVLRRADRGGGRHHRRRAAGHHPLPVATSCSSPTPY